MDWTVVKITNERKGKTLPYASVGFGRLSLSSGACGLIDGFDKYSFVELLQAKDKGQRVIGVRFLKENERTSNSLPIKRRKMKDGRLIKSVDIANKATIEELFGINGTQRKATRYDVRLDETDSKILIISGQ